MAEADFFGMVSGDATDKFAISGLTPLRADHVDAPCIAGFSVVLECRVAKHVKIGAHTQFIGEILDVKIDESMLDSERKPDIERLQVIGFDVFRSAYYKTGPVAGRAYSAGRKYLSE